MVKTKKQVLYTVKEIKEMFSTTEQVVRNRLCDNKIKKFKTNGSKIALYTDKDVNKLRIKYGMVDLHHEKVINNYKNTPIIITYYIYESKMNRDEE
jgi:hypothetical protein